MVLPPRNGLSLCAGAGGLDMGLMLAEPGFHTRCFVEWEEYPREALIAAQRAGYFAPAPIWDDVTTFDAKPLAGCIDTLLAGYPCQPFSQAGQRKGENDERHLWPDIERIIGELGDGLRWCFFENVAGHLTLGLEAVLRSLRDLGFTPAVGVFSAEEVGATHERQRVFIVAYRAVEDAELARTGSRTPPAGEPGRNTVDWRGALLRRGDGSTGADWPAAASEPLDYSASARRDRSGQRPEALSEGRKRLSGDGRTGLFPPAPGDMPKWSAALAMAPDLAPAVAFGDIARQAREFAALVATGQLEEAEVESTLRRMVDGLASRSRALRLLGNGVCPLAAGYAWRTLSAAHGLGRVDLGAEARDTETGPTQPVLRQSN
ncbi:MAG: DNA cytosine methyltransferase [Nisaea sp.]|uniref:DNA cytosine methyltransferase n=1 Tax=Alphaproteobacteria TaxID=28211 RepID=UPI003264B9BD